jgi:hypothetical protein
VLDCVSTKPDDNIVSIDSTATTIYSKVINTCSGQLEKDIPLQISMNRSPMSYGSSDIMQLLFDPRGTSATAQLPNSKTPSANRDNSSCPSIVMALGSFPNAPLKPTNQTRPPTTPSRNLTSSEATVVTLACTQRLEEVDTKTTFLLPGWSLDLSTPPVPDESSKRSIGGVYQFPAVSSLVNTFGVLSSNTTFRNDVGNRFGSFLAAVVHGKNGVPAAELLADSDRLSHAVSDLYGRYMAQVMARRMRTMDGTRSIEAVVSKPEARLVMNAGARLGLQALLGVMLGCGLVSWATMRNAAFLPHCPCSIAGTACLLDDREFWGARGRNWRAEEHTFKLSLRNGRMGIHAVDAEGEHLMK